MHAVHADANSHWTLALCAFCKPESVLNNYKGNAWEGSSCVPFAVCSVGSHRLIMTPTHGLNVVISQLPSFQSNTFCISVICHCAFPTNTFVNGMQAMKTLRTWNSLHSVGWLKWHLSAVKIEFRGFAGNPSAAQLVCSAPLWERRAPDPLGSLKVWISLLESPCELCLSSIWQETNLQIQSSWQNRFFLEK